MNYDNTETTFVFQVLMNGDITIDDLPPSLDICQVKTYLIT